MEEVLFQAWKEKYDVSYADEEEEASRRGVFVENLAELLDVEYEHLASARGSETFYGLNRFSDMTWCVYGLPALRGGSLVGAAWS